MTTTQIRAIAEAAITYHATMLGIVVLEPLTEGRRYDLVLDTGDLLLRTQCNGLVARATWWSFEAEPADHAERV